MQLLAKMLKSIFHSNMRACAVQSGLAPMWISAARKLGHRVSRSAISTPSLQGREPEALPQKLQGPALSLLESDGTNQAKVQPCPDSLSTFLSRLSLSPEEAAATIQYKLPSKSSGIQSAILDPIASVSIPWECPTAVNQDYVDVPSHQRVDIFIDDPGSNVTVEKKASNILQKRHKKMKRHQYKKWRKRNRFKLRMQKQRRRKKRRERWERYLNRFRFNELKAGEGEQYLQKKQERLNIYLRYLGVDVEDTPSERKEGGEGESKKKKRGPSCIMSGTGKLVPSPIVPEGAPLR